jgi:hypothetical protein
VYVLPEYARNPVPVGTRGGARLFMPESSPAQGTSHHGIEYDVGMQKQIAIIPLMFAISACQPAEPPTIQSLRTQVTYCAFSSGTTKTKLDIKFDFSGWITAYSLHWTPSLVNGKPPSKLEDFAASQIQTVQVSQLGANQDVNLPRSGTGTITTNFFLTANADGTVKVALLGTGDSGRIWVQAFNNALGSGVLQGETVTADSSATTCDPADTVLP